MHQNIPGKLTPSGSATRQARAVDDARQAVKRQMQRRREEGAPRNGSGWKRETRKLPRSEAREFARAFLKKYPKAAYWSEVESWRVLEDDVIEFTMRRLPTAD